MSESAVDLEIVASSYRLVSDETAFHDLLNAWEKKLFLAESGQADSGPYDPGNIVTNHLREVRELIAKKMTPDCEDPLDDAISAVAAPAVVLTPRGVVATTNASARHRFSAIQGQLNALDWVDPVSLEDFEAVRRSASQRGNRRHAVIRTIDPEGERGVAEAYVLEWIEGHAAYIVVRALETGWAAEIDTVLEEAFGLTSAEREVARLLYETCDSTRIAEQRNTSSQTVRTQIKAILAKTDTASQVDLIRLLGLLTARESHGRRSKHDQWRDPWGHERILIRPNGQRLAYSWAGAENGRPALLIHGNTLGYILGERIETQLRDAGIKLYAISRPGFGNSDSGHDTEPFGEHCDAIEWFMDELELSDIAGIALGSGSPMLLALAARRPDLFRRLLTTGMILPPDAEEMVNMPPTPRIFMKLVFQAPRVAELIAKTAERHVRQKGIEWYLEHCWGKMPETRRAIDDPEITPLIRNAGELTISGRSVNFIRDLQCAWLDYRASIPEITCPVHHMRGADDRSISAQKAASFAALAPHFSTETVAGAGFFLPYERPRLFAERLIETVNG